MPQRKLAIKLGKKYTILSANSAEGLETSKKSKSMTRLMIKSAINNKGRRSFMIDT